MTEMNKELKGYPKKKEEIIGPLIYNQHYENGKVIGFNSCHNQFSKLLLERTKIEVLAKKLFEILHCPMKWEDLRDHEKQVFLDYAFLFQSWIRKGE